MTQRSRFRASPLLPQALCLLCVALPVAAFAAFSPAARADVYQLSPDESNALFDKAKAAVVQVRAGDKGLVSGGTGFFIDDQGTVLTSSSIVGDNTRARVVINGVEVDAKILGDDARSGLAMLRVPYAASSSLSLAHSSGLKSGDGVMVIGFPLNLPVAPTQGPVSGFDASFLEKPDASAPVAKVERFATTHIHANVPISPGEVGAPLLNSRGEVVGLVATSPDDGRSVYALPIEAMSKITADFSQYGAARYGWVGIDVTEQPDLAHDGRTVRVVRTVPGTPASESGIHPGDTVMRIDSREIYRPADVLDASFFSKVGETMNVVVRRDDKLFNYSFPIIERSGNVPNHVAADPGH